MGTIVPHGDVDINKFYDKQFTPDEKSEDSGVKDQQDEIEEDEDAESTDEVSDEETDDVSDEDDENDPDEPEDDKEPDYKALYLDAEEKRRKTQSRLGRTEFEFNSLKDELSTVKEEIGGLKNNTRESELDVILDEIADDGFVEGRMAKKLVKAIKQRDQQQVVQKPQAQKVDTKRFNEWVLDLTDGDDINDYFEKNRSVATSRMEAIPTSDPFARMQELRLMHREEVILNLQEELKKAKKNVNKLKRRSKKPKVPATGPRGRNVASPTSGKNTRGLTAGEYFNS